MPWGACRSPWGALVGALPTQSQGRKVFPITALLPDSSFWESRLASTAAAPLPSRIVLHWPALFAAQGHEEDILPILWPLSLIEMGNKTRLQKKGLLWAALLEENESPKQIGFHDLRQTSLFIVPRSRLIVQEMFICFIMEEP